MLRKTWWDVWIVRRGGAPLERVCGTAGCRQIPTFFVTGGAGSLTRDFKHLAVDMYLIEEEGEKKLRVDAHFSKRKQLAAIRTTCSHVQVCGLLLSVGLSLWAPTLAL